MCTLALRFAPGTAAPVLVAANRDELLDRPAVGPFVWPGRGFLAPRDERAGGTWLGLTRAGTFVGVTNRFLAPRDPSRRSRGLAVLDALEAQTPSAIAALVTEAWARAHNPFHLVWADAREAWSAAWTGDRFERHPLPPGWHVVTEQSFGAGPDTRAARLGAWLAGLGEPSLTQLEDALRVTVPGDPLGSVRVTLPTLNYGTRSSLVLRLGAAPTLHATLGPPDTTPFVDQTGLLAELSA